MPQDDWHTACRWSKREGIGFANRQEKVVQNRLKPAVIVINSHVARGSVGGRGATFVLERLGFPVWCVPTVHYPFHPGHGRKTARYSAEADIFAALLDDLRDAPWLGEVGGVLTGYLGAASQAEPIARLIETLKARNGAVTYLCDPILGDSTGPYQPAEVTEAVKDLLLPLADIATPNRFELGWLSGESGGLDNAALAAAARKLPPANVLVTSAFAGEGEIGNLLVRGDEAILATHPLVINAPSGTGDLLSALYLGHVLDGLAPVDALNRAVSTVAHVVEMTDSLGLDEIPLTMAQDLFVAPPTEPTTVRPLTDAQR